MLGRLTTPTTPEHKLNPYVFFVKITRELPLAQGVSCHPRVAVKYNVRLAHDTPVLHDNDSLNEAFAPLYPTLQNDNAASFLRNHRLKHEKHYTHTKCDSTTPTAGQRSQHLAPLTDDRRPRSDAPTPASPLPACRCRRPRSRRLHPVAIRPRASYE